MICPSCKAEIADGCIFCPNCGSPLTQEYQETPVPQEEAPGEEAPEELQEESPVEVTSEEPAELPAEGPYTVEVSGTPVAEELPKKSKKGLIIGICAAVVVIALIIAAISVFSSNPLALVREAAQNSMNSGITRAKEAGNKASLSISYDLKSLTGDLLGYELPASADILVAADGGNKSAALNASVSFMGKSFADATASLDEENLVISSDALLGDAYGINLADAAKNLPGSVLNPAKGYLTQAQYDSFMSTVEHRGESEALIKDLAAIEQDILGVVFKSVEKNSKAAKEKGVLEFGPDTCDVTDVTVEINAKQLAEIASDTVEYLKNDAELKEKLNMLSGSYAELIESMTGKPLSEAIENFYKDLDKFDKNDILKDYDEKDTVILLRFHINGSKELVGAKAEFPKDDMEFEFVCGPDIAGPTYFALDFKVEKDSGRIESRVSEKSDIKYSQTVFVNVNGIEPVTVSIDWNKVTGDFTIKSGDIVIKADVTKNDDVITIIPRSVEGLGIEEYNDYLTKATITITRSAEFPAIPNYKDILTMSEDEINDVAEEIKSIPDTLIYSLYTLLY